MKKDVFFKIVCPLLLMKESTVICISTLDNKPNGFYEEMINKPRPRCPDKTLFHQFNYDFRCNVCKSDESTVVMCKHMSAKLPKWQSQYKHEIVQAIMSSEAGDWLRETQGVRDEDTPACFNPSRVNSMMTGIRIDVGTKIGYERVDWVYVCIDPNTGKHDSSTRITHSDFAIVSAIDALDFSGLIITGLESIDSHTPHDYLGKLTGHLKALRSRFKNAKVCIMIENNLGQEADWLKIEIEKNGISGCVFMNDGDLKTGVRTSHQIKKDMMLKTSRLFFKNQLFMAVNLISMNQDKMPMQKLNDEFKRQLLNYVEMKKPPSDLFGETKVVWTGKINPGTKDDMCVALQLLIYWKDVFHNHDKYKMYW